MMRHPLSLLAVLRVCAVVGRTSALHLYGCMLLQFFFCIKLVA